jgi:hypothetical protein
MYDLEHIHAMLKDAAQVALIDDDFLPLAKWLNELEKYIQQEKQDERV